MIRFTCRCGHLFEAGDDLAGGAVQCPRCHLLNDVPLLSDLPAMADDGTYRVDATVAPADPGKINELIYAFARTKVDADGNPIDLRNTEEEMANVGAADTINDLQRRGRPRYDPETGERVDPIPIAAKNEPAAQPPDVPFAKAALIYANDAAHRSRTAGYVLMELLRPHNLIVMAFVYAIYLLGGLTGVVIALQLYFFFPVALAVAVTIIAHYGNVVNEIGVEERDELPRVLGDIQFYEDIWQPASSIVAALLICYGPAALVFLLPVSIAAAAAGASMLALFGSYLLPATALTLLSSGSLSNLRPDRLFAVIHLSRGKYLDIAVVCFFAVAGCTWGMTSLIIEGLRMGLQPVVIPEWATSLLVAFPLLLAANFAMHYAGWQLGLLYRANQDRFPWVGRRYIAREPRPPVVRRKPKYVTHATEDGKRSNA